MKHLLVLSFAIPLFLAGCERTTSTGAGGKQLTITKPSDESLTQGETGQISVSIKRNNFRDPVSVQFTGLPQGVEVLDADNQITAEQDSATFTLRASDTAAPVENHRATVTVTGPGGVKATESFQVTIKPKA